MVACVDQFVSEMAVLYLGDSVEILKSLPDESVHYAIYSPPFASLYTYSNSERDLGNCRNRGESSFCTTSSLRKNWRAS